MLYERWRQIAGACPNDLALRELGSGRQWTFRELTLAAERSPGDDRKIAFPQGISADFIVAVLAAWRRGQAVCPLEPGQSETLPAAALPEKIVHLKATSASTGE